MGTTATLNSPTPAATARGRTLRAVAIVGALAATAVNIALWVIGQVTDASFLATPPGAHSTMTVGLELVIPATLASFAAGALVLGWAARRSHRLVRAVLLAAGGFAVLSIAGPLTAAEDAGSGVLLAGMHLATGAAFVITATAWLRRAHR